MNEKIYYFFLIGLAMILSCQSEPIVNKNLPAPGFNLEESDDQAIVLADKVMEAMGGRAAWDSTEYIQWNFFNVRRHIWNKKTNDVFIEGIRDTFTIHMNVDDVTGTVIYQENTLTKSDSLDQYLQKGKEMWINDAYWLVMPYKLKDSGVTLKYLGRDTTMYGQPAEVLQLTFTDVGVTPDNKYHVYVDPETNLVTQWDFFRRFDDEKPRFSTPWDSYKKYGTISLSSGRGKGRNITEIEVGSHLAVRMQKKSG